MYYKKRRNKIIPIFIGSVCLLALLVFLFDPFSEKDVGVTTDAQVQSETEPNTDIDQFQSNYSASDSSSQTASNKTNDNVNNSNNNEDKNSDITKKNTTNADVQGTNSQKKSYYLLKNDNGIIKIYFCDETGRETLLEETGILYEVLPEKDQEAFNEGIKAANRDELFTLLQDFEG